MANEPNRKGVLTPVSPRGRGRPRVTEPRTTVCAWVEARHYDQIVRLANQQEKSVSAMVRELLIVRLK